MRILKKSLKIAGIIIVSIILFMIILVLGAKIFEDELASFTMERLETEIDAPMSIGTVSLNPLFSFPRLSADINKLWIGDPKSQNNDTLFFINSLKVGLDSWDLINGIYTIDKVEISGLNFDYTVDNNGNSNIDFISNIFIDTIPKVQTVNTNAPLELSAEKFKLENIRINYYDSLSHTGAQVYIPEISLKAKSKNETYSGKTDGSFVISQCSFEETNLDQMESCIIDFEMEYKDDKAVINKLSINSDGIDIGIKGIVRPGKTLKTDLKIETKKLNFDILKKYIPNEYSHFYGETKINKTESIIINIKMDYKDNNIDIKQLSIDNQGINLEVAGNVDLKDTLHIDADINELALDFDALKTYIPIQYLKEYGIIDIGGKMNISANIKGQYADSTLMPSLNADIDIRSLRLQTTDYPKIDTINLIAQLSNGEKLDMSEASVNITSLDIFSPKSSVHLQGSISDIINPKYKLKTDLDINLMEFESFIPDSLAQKLEGKITASIETTGILPDSINDDFTDYVLDKTTLSLNIEEVSALLMDSIQVQNFSTNIQYAPQDSASKKIQINNLNLQSESLNLNIHNSSLSAFISGKLADPLMMSADLDSFNIQNGKSIISGKGKVNNFGAPEYDINSNITLELEELIAFVPDSLVKTMAGTINAKIESKGRINPDSLDVQMFPLIFENSSFDIALNNISLSFPDSIMNIDSLTGQIALKNDLLKLDHFNAVYNGFKLGADSSIIQNIYKAVLLNQKEQLYVKTHIKLGSFLFDDFKHLIANKTSSPSIDTISTKDTTNISNTKNWTFLIHGSASVNSLIIDSTALDKFDINRLHINDISALFKLTDSAYIVDQFKFKVFEGEMNNSLHYKLRKDGTKSVSTHNIIQNMNIQTLLRDMDNFGMDSVITHENISGLFSTDLNTFVPIGDSVLINKMLVSGELTLEKGGVYNFPPAQEISKFTSIKELDNIQFKTLRSNIFMFKNKLYIPRTDIVSNAIDIAAFGMQSMIDDSEYHLEVHLSNILFGKSKRRNKKQDKSGEEIDKESLKKNSRKVKYASTAGKSKVGLDNKKSREMMMNKIRIQKKMLDFIFFPKNIHYNTDLGNDKK